MYLKNGFKQLCFVQTVGLNKNLLVWVKRWLHFWKNEGPTFHWTEQQPHRTDFFQLTANLKLAAFKIPWWLPGVVMCSDGFMYLLYVGIKKTHQIVINIKYQSVPWLMSVTGMWSIIFPWAKSDQSVLTPLSRHSSSSNRLTHLGSEVTSAVPFCAYFTQIWLILDDVTVASRHHTPVPWAHPPPHFICWLCWMSYMLTSLKPVVLEHQPGETIKRHIHHEEGEERMSQLVVFVSVSAGRSRCSRSSADDTGVADF